MDSPTVLLLAGLHRVWGERVRRGGHEEPVAGSSPRLAGAGGTEGWASVLLSLGASLLLAALGTTAIPPTVDTGSALIASIQIRKRGRRVQ